jgi:hypothetical protein
MSDEPFQLLTTPPLVSAVQARDVARAYKGLADHLLGLRATAEARRLEQQSQWWMTYSLALSQIPPGATDPNN